MAHCRALIVLKAGLSPGQLLPPLLQSMGLEVEQPGRHSLMALERPCRGRPTRDYVRLWADWSEGCQSNELWLETLSGESMARSGSRCSRLLDQLTHALSQ